jgi:hypothetical protein
MDDSERRKLAMADEMIQRAVAESMNLKTFDAENEDRLRSIRKMLTDAREQIRNLLGPDW